MHVERATNRKVVFVDIEGGYVVWAFDDGRAVYVSMYSRGVIIKPKKLPVTSAERRELLTYVTNFEQVEHKVVRPSSAYLIDAMYNAIVAGGPEKLLFYMTLFSFFKGSNALSLPEMKDYPVLGCELTEYDLWLYVNLMTMIFFLIVIFKLCSMKKGLLSVFLQVTLVFGFAGAYLLALASLRHSIPCANLVIRFYPHTVLVFCAASVCALFAYGMIFFCSVRWFEMLFLLVLLHGALCADLVYYLYYGDQFFLVYMFRQVLSSFLINVVYNLPLVIFLLALFTWFHQRSLRWQHRFLTQSFETKLRTLATGVKIVLQETGGKEVIMGDYTFKVPPVKLEAHLPHSRPTDIELVSKSMVVVTNRSDFVLGGAACYGTGRFVCSYHQVRGEDLRIHYYSKAFSKYIWCDVELIAFNDHLDIAILSGPLIRSLSLALPTIGSQINVLTKAMLAKDVKDAFTSNTGCSPGTLTDPVTHGATTLNSDSGKPLMFGNAIVGVHLAGRDPTTNRCVTWTPDLITWLRSHVNRSYEKSRGDYTDAQMQDIAGVRGFTESDRESWTENDGKSFVMYQRQENGAYIMFEIGSDSIYYGANNNESFEFENLQKMDSDIGSAYNQRNMNTNSKRVVQANRLRYSAKRAAKSRGDKVSKPGARNTAINKGKDNYMKGYKAQKKLDELRNSYEFDEPDFGGQKPKVEPQIQVEVKAPVKPSEPAKKWSDEVDDGELPDIPKVLIIDESEYYNPVVPKEEEKRPSAWGGDEEKNILQEIDSPAPLVDSENDDEASEEDIYFIPGCRVEGTAPRRFYASPSVYPRTGYSTFTASEIGRLQDAYPFAECKADTELRVFTEFMTEKITQETLGGTIHREDWKKAWENYLSIVFQRIKPSKQLSFDEALRTFELDGLLEKACGAPFSQSCPCGTKHTKKGEVIACGPAVALLRKQFDAVCAGESPEVILETFCKQERLKKKKFDLGKTRLVFTNSMLSEICLRSQFHDGIKNLHHFAETLPIKIGMNIHNGGLNRLFSELLHFSTSVESDVTNMDACATEEGMTFCFGSWQFVFKIDQELPLSKFNLKTICGSKLFALGGLLIRMLNGGYNNSGHFLTGEMNSMELLFFNFVLLHKTPPSLKKIIDNINKCLINVYGDDNLSSFNYDVTLEDVLVAAKKLGLNITKDKVVIRKKQTSSDDSFLNGASFLGQVGHWIQHQWAFVPARPEKILSNFFLSGSHELLGGDGERGCVASILANFCYDDIVPIFINGKNYSVYDSISTTYIAKTGFLIPTRSAFKAARSGEEKGDDVKDIKFNGGDLHCDLTLHKSKITTNHAKDKSINRPNVSNDGARYGTRRVYMAPKEPIKRGESHSGTPAFGSGHAGPTVKLGGSPKVGGSVPPSKEAGTPLPVETKQVANSTCKNDNNYAKEQNERKETNKNNGNKSKTARKREKWRSKIEKQVLSKFQLGNDSSSESRPSK